MAGGGGGGGGAQKNSSYFFPVNIDINEVSRSRPRKCSHPLSSFDCSNVCGEPNFQFQPT